MGLHRHARRPPSSTPPTTSARPTATPTACSSSPAGSCSTWEPRPSWPATAISRPCLFLGPVRWLLIKDLRILRRSPLLVGLLILYPVVVAILIGAALTGGPEKPKVAFANLAGDASFDLGGETLNANSYTSRFFEAVDPIRVKTREEAIEKVRSGEALAALVVPAGRRPAPAGHALAGRRRAAHRRGLLQRRGPGQAALRRVDDRVAARRGQRGAQRRRAGAVGQVPRPRGQGRRAVVPARGRRPDPRVAQRTDADRHVAEGASRRTPHSARRCRRSAGSRGWRPRTSI